MNESSRETSGRLPLIAASVCAVCMLVAPARPVFADDQEALLARIEKVEREMQRLDALEKRVAEVCAQLDLLTGQMTEYSVRQSSANGNGDTEDEDYWEEYWKQKAQDCH